MSGTNTRRQFIKRAGFSAIAAGALGGAYSLHRGIRYPRLGLEPPALPHAFVDGNEIATISSSDVIQTPNKADRTLALRAFSAEPTLHIRAVTDGDVAIEIGNVSTDAELVWNTKPSDLNEQKSGINRTLTLTLQKGEEHTLTWNLPFESDFTFASIGDSGGDKELAWCIRRAHELGAKFLLHLGDFNYQAGDYQRSIELFNSSPIPCYVSIGNHDFHENGLIYDRFLDQIGPLNHAFTIGKTRFVNLDTAASTLPYSAGLRGALIDRIAPRTDTVRETVAFTHRPLHDPLHNSSHDIGSVGERDWLIAALKSINAPSLLSGHIHIYDRTEFNGIDNIIAGQGLGHQDLITQSDYSKMVLGRVANDGTVAYSAEPLSMPMELHCHPRSQPVIDSLRGSSNAADYKTLLDRLAQACAT